MAGDDTIKTFVAKLQVDGGDLEGQLKQARQDFAAFAADTKSQATVNDAANAAAVAGIKEQVQATKEVQTATKEVQTAKEAASKAAIAGAEAEKVAQEKVTAALEKQIEKLKERAEASKAGSEEGGISGILKGFSTAGIQGAAGSGVLGKTLTGLLGGAGLTLGLEAAYEGFEKLIDKMKEFIEDSGGLQKVTDTFQKLTHGAGTDPTEFLEQLRKATHDLVPDVELLRAANTFMQSGLKMSSEDMVKLTEATVGLARAQGHDASDAIKQLTQSFLSGRTQSLGYQTGIQKTLLSVTGLGQTLSQAQKSNLTFAQTVKMIEERYANLSQPMLTYTDRLKQLSVVQGQLFEGVAQGVVTSQGFTSFMKSLGEIIEKLGGMEATVKKLGDIIGNTFVLMSSAFRIFGSTAKTAIEPVIVLLSSLKGFLLALGSHFDVAAHSGDAFTNMMQAQHPIILATVKLMAAASREIKEFIADGVAMSNMTMLPARIADIMDEHKNDKIPFTQHNASYQALKEIKDEWKGSYDAADSEYNKQTKQVGTDMYRGWKEPNPRYTGVKTGGADDDAGLARRHALANAQAASQLQQALAKQDLEATKAILEDETAANDKMYKEGDEDATTYYANKNKLAERTKIATVTALLEEAEAQKKLLNVQVQQDSKFKDSAEVQKQAIDQRTQAGIDAANTLEAKTKAGDVTGLFGANKEATMKAADIQLQIIKTSLAEQVDATKYAFSQNEISADQYHQQRIDQINAELQATIDAEQKKQAVMSTAERLISKQKIDEAYTKNQKDLTTFGDQFSQEDASNIQSHYTTLLGINKAQQDISAVTGQGSDELITEQESFLQEYIDKLTAANAQVKMGTDQWLKTQEIIQQVSAELQKIQETNAINNSTTTQMGNLGSSIGAAGTGLFTGTFGKGFMSSFSQGAGFLQNSAKLNNQYAADADNKSDTNIVDALSDSIKDVTSGSDGSFLELGKTLSTAAESIGNFAKVIASSTSPLGGAFGGGQAGGGLGASIGGSQGVSSALGVSQGVGGLLGGIGGAVFGAALGAIVGEKQQEVQHDIAQIQLTVLQLTEAFSAGTASLNTTIQALQGVIATLTSEQANSKKGSTQFQDLINQYNQQLTQLEAQQTQTIQQMTQQLASVSSPEAYQQWIQNIDQVIQQYSQFAGAAQNATQLAQANEYLTSSLQNIGQQLGDQIMQEEESAIQNALQLNQLYNQRNQLELQYLNQVQSIMSQGNLTRQRTQAQSAFSQLYDAQVNYSQQLDSINQQINLAQYQLSVEQQIFNLATTKAGLESQLLSLQEQGVNEDMQRITAMQNLLATLQSTGYSITNLGALSSSDPNALANQLLQDLVSELNTGQSTMIQQLEQLINVLTEYGGTGATIGSQVPTPNVAGTTIANPNAVTDIFAAAYQARAAFAYGAFRAQNL